MSLDTVFASLPVPAILIDTDDTIAELNSEAEGFLNASAKSVRGVPVWDMIAVDAPLEEAFTRARDNGTPLFVNDVDVGSGQRPPVQCALHFAPLIDAAGQMILMITPREMAGRMTQNNSVKSAAKSAIGMAEMHAKRFVHRDLKPGNILLTDRGVCKVADLGYSRDEGGRRRPEGWLGTPRGRQEVPGDFFCVFNGKVVKY